MDGLYLDCNKEGEVDWTGGNVGNTGDEDNILSILVDLCCQLCQSLWVWWGCIERMHMDKKRKRKRKEGRFIR